jgi:hypothetical protein
MRWESELQLVNKKRDQDGAARWETRITIIAHGMMEGRRAG